MRVVIDTCIFMNVLNDEPGANASQALLRKILKGEVDGLISVITIAELFSLYGKINERAAARAKGLVVRIVGEENLAPVLIQVAELAGRLKTKYRGVSLGDSLILATAILAGSDAVITRDPALTVVEEIKVLRPEDVKS
jgi:predicted nucleic acid-binding protein